MLSKPEVARFASALLPAMLRDHASGVHRALVSFHAGVLLEYIAKVKALDENAMIFLLPAAMEPLQTGSDSQSEVKPVLLHESIVSAFLSTPAHILTSCISLEATSS